MRVTEDFLRGRSRSAMSDDDKAALEAAVSEVRDFPARALVTRRGEEVRECMLLVEGAMCRYMDARDGYRQLVAYHVAGDFVDLHGYPMKRLDHDVGTIAPSRIAIIPHQRVDEIMRERPDLARLMWHSTLLDAAMHREWIFRLGRLDAVGRVAHFLSELCQRLHAVGRVRDGCFELPMTQQDLGEACGLTAVHVNRTLRRLREDGLADVTRGVVTIKDGARLARAGEFEADYLYLENGPWTP